MTIHITKLAAKITPVMTLLLVASPAMAGTPAGNIPEPGMLPLFGLGAVVMIAVAIRNHRNKK